MAEDARARVALSTQSMSQCGLTRPLPGDSRVSGDSSEVGPPVPIPNTVVKGLSADDTRGTRPRDNRPLPETLFAFAFPAAPASSRGLGRHPFKVEITGSNPVAGTSAWRSWRGAPTRWAASRRSLPRGSWRLRAGRRTFANRARGCPAPTSPPRCRRSRRSARRRAPRGTPSASCCTAALVDLEAQPGPRRQVDVAVLHDPGLACSQPSPRPASTCSWIRKFGTTRIHLHAGRERHRPDRAVGHDVHVVRLGHVGDALQSRRCRRRGRRRAGCSATA